MSANHTEPPVETLKRWEHHGATWRTVHLSDAKAIVDLCTRLRPYLDEKSGRG